MRRVVTGAVGLALLASALVAPVAAAVPERSPTADPVPPSLAGEAWTHIPTRKKLVALTFDAGGGAKGVTSILRTLEQEGITATFFLTGRWARAFPGKVRAIARAGHVLGNHTDTHGKVPDWSTARLQRELRRTDRAVRAAAGRGTKPWFRFPYGAHRAADIRRLNDLGYVPVQWTVDAAGWLGTSGGMSAASVERRVLAALRPGAIVLMHVGEHPSDGSTLDADALPRLIRDLRDRGYRFTTVEALQRHA